MRFRALALLTAFASIAMFATGVATAPAARAEIVDRLDEPAADIVATKWFGPDLSKIEKLRGRVVIVHFSRPEVITSRAAIPTLRQLAESGKDRALTVIEVVVSDDEAKAAAYVEKESPKWSVAFDGNGTAAMKYAGTSVPRTYLIGPDGRIVWHAHIASLPAKLVDEQLARVPFFTPSPALKAGKAAAKCAAEMRFKAALDECAKIDADTRASAADRDLAKAIRAEVPRAYEFLMARAEALYQAQDYGLSWRRFERLLLCFKGLEQEALITKRMAELDSEKIVPYVRRAQDELEHLIADSPTRTAKQIAELVAKLRKFAIKYSPTVPSERADAYADALEKGT